jgi:UDP:flavonoid glycosyltransferase YjiC (YdhE family)
VVATLHVGGAGVSAFLFVVPPLAGHVNPTIGVAAALAARGHRVAWVGQPDVIAPMLAPGATVYPCDGVTVDDDAVHRPPTMRGPAALKFLWEKFFIPLAERMVPGVHAAVTDFQPDVLVVDQHTIAGALVADALGMPWATASTTSAELTEPLAAMPKVLAWVREQLAELQRGLGGAAAGVGDPRISPYLVLAFTSDALTGPGPAAVFGDRLAFLGPSIAPRPANVDFPWSWLDGAAPTVLVSLGTVNDDAGGRFLCEAVDAVAARPWLRAVVVDPSGAVTATPGNVLLRPRVPQLELLPRMAAVLCHAGHNTVCEALFHGLPLVVAPIRDDQPVIAQQAVDAGAAVRVRFGRAGAAHIGAALDEVLTVPTYRAAAQRIGASFRTAGGADTAADLLVALGSRGADLRTSARQRRS